MQEDTATIQAAADRLGPGESIADHLWPGTYWIATPVILAGCCGSGTPDTT